MRYFICLGLLFSLPAMAEDVGSSGTTNTGPGVKVIYAANYSLDVAKILSTTEGATLERNVRLKSSNADVDQVIIVVGERGDGKLYVAVITTPNLVCSENGGCASCQLKRITAVKKVLKNQKDEWPGN